MHKKNLQANRINLFYYSLLLRSAGYALLSPAGRPLFYYLIRFSLRVFTCLTACVCARSLVLVWGIPFTLTLVASESIFGRCLFGNLHLATLDT